MSKRTTKSPGWSDVKARVSDQSQKQLLQLVADLYRLSKENREFLHARFSVGDDSLGPYKERIRDCMYPDVYSNKPVQVSKARRAISSYSKATGDPLGEAELMTVLVEYGNRFTVDFGDMDGPFYDSLNRAFQKAIDKVLSLPQEQRDGFRERLEAIMKSSSGIGWGYHDALVEDYHRAFPQDD
jgi:hypothetical protein